MRAGGRSWPIAPAACAGAIGALLLLLLSGTPLSVSFRGFLTERLPRNLAEAGRPGGGERRLPDPVRAALGLLRDHDVAAYRVSRRLGFDPGLWLPTFAAAWPIRPDEGASWYLAFSDEALPAGCRTVERRAGMQLARCP
ncbi:MAG TPA: hypothetical protein VFA23_05455 [Dongiaceae bacterium]|nr:hypothetical protein [Dongiaceae bacterium]